MNTREADFQQIALAFCSWAERGLIGAEPHHARAALHLLVDLYAAALELPTSPPCGEDVETEPVHQDEWQRLVARMGALPFGCYSVVDEPHAVPPAEPVVGHLADDLADVYRDIQGGLSLWTAGHRVEAVWHWRFHFRAHWGRHAVDAIRALHVWLEREGAL